MPLHMFLLQQNIFRGSKFYICSISISLFMSTSYISTKQILLLPEDGLLKAETYVGASDLLVRIQYICWFLNFGFVIMMHGEYNVKFLIPIFLSSSKRLKVDQ
jgi:hypothetical protein